ncbi:MAG: class I SAM-dependent methyltransferase [Candidatus Binataceae bacterium]
MKSTQTWEPERYVTNARYVASFADFTLPMLAPRRGEKLLDLGCGDGFVSERLVAAGANVIGVDPSIEMIEAARRRGLDARVKSVYDLEFDREFDGVFTNSVLHWVLDPDRAAARVFSALKTGGRFVGEFGGHGCCAGTVVATGAVLKRRGIDIASVNPWYYPTADEYRAVLERAGFAVSHIELAPLPVRLATGMEAFIETFCENFFRPLEPEDRRIAKTEMIDLIRPAFCDRAGNWTMDFVRLRFAARRTW